MKLEASKVSLKPDPDDTINTSTLPSTLCIPAMFTATTATITPTTLRNIEQAFLEINNTENESMPFQAGFVPPPATAASYHSSVSADGGAGSDNDFTDNDSESMMSMGSSDNAMSPVAPVVVEEVKDIGRKIGGKGGSRKNKGGRRPNKASNLSPEEEEKRRVRRERNKMAAARCRRRREDRTKELSIETEILENKKRSLQMEVEELEREKQDLEFLLESHKSSCKRIMRHETSLLHVKADPEIANTLLSLADRIKAEPMEIVNNPVQDGHNDNDERKDNDDDDDSDRTQSPKRKILLTSAAIDPLPTITKQDTMISVNVPKINRPNRPNTLNVPLLGGTTSQALNSIPIQTPSNGIFNFESLMDGGTGLTPVQPKIMGESSKTSLELITPTSEGTKLI